MFAQTDEVAKLMKGSVVGQRRVLLETNINNLSIRLSAWHPGLRDAWEKADPDSDLHGLLSVMVGEVAAKMTENPDGYSSETMGPFAYSKFDSEDWVKHLFKKRDLDALLDLLRLGKRKQRGSITLSPSLKPSAPITQTGRVTNYVGRGRPYTRRYRRP